MALKNKGQRNIPTRHHRHAKLLFSSSHSFAFLIASLVLKVVNMSPNWAELEDGPGRSKHISPRDIKNWVAIKSSKMSYHTGS